jgi:O-antigen/teichoic acid export membrane protein
LGVIKRQSLKFTIVNFIGTFIGFLSVILIYPLDREAYGYFQFIFSSATLLVPILGLGLYGFIVQYGPFLEQKKLKSYLLSFSLRLMMICIVVMSTVVYFLYPLLEPTLYKFFKNFSDIYNNIDAIYLVSILLIICGVMSSVAASYYRIVLPDIIQNLLLKFLLPIAIFCFANKYLELVDFKWMIVGFYALVALGLFYYVTTLTKHKWGSIWDRFTKVEYVEMGKYIGFVSINSVGAQLALKLDNSMIGSMISIAAVGSFSLIMTISNVIDIPTKALYGISSPIISSSWANHNTQNIQSIYAKSSLYGCIIGIFLFQLIYHIWPEIIAIMPGDKGGLTVELATSVFLCLGLAKIINISAGVNNLIILFSKDYKYQMYFYLLLALLNIGFNYLFIEMYGILGAAIATLISLFVFNVVQSAFVYFKFGFFLDIRNMFVVIAYAIALFFIYSMISLPFHPFINMVVKGIIITISYMILMWRLNPGGELRSEIRQSLTKAKAWLPPFFHSLIDKI